MESKLEKKKQPSSLISTYNLPHTLNISTWIQKDSSTATNNIFVDNSTLQLPYESLIINCLSNYVVQIVTIKNIHATINNHEISDMTKKKKHGSLSTKINILIICFNSFLCTFLNIFKGSFSVKYKSTEEKMTGLHNK